MNFEDFFSEFAADPLSHKQFVFNALLGALLAYLLGLFYSRFGNTIVNRSKFASNFVLLALATMLIIYIVKSSVALSLGLVGALSIVRFRAAIKEPEELVYLFLVIGIGIGMGSNQPGITVLAFVIIISIGLIQAMVQRKQLIRAPENMFINISTTEIQVEEINKILSDHFSLVELKRMDQFKGKLDLSYIIETKDIDHINKAKNALVEQAPNLSFSFVEQRNLAL